MRDEVEQLGHFGLEIHGLFGHGGVLVEKQGSTLGTPEGGQHKAEAQAGGPGAQLWARAGGFKALPV